MRQSEVQKRMLREDKERGKERESESEWFSEKGHGPMSVVVKNTVKQKERERCVCVGGGEGGEGGGGGYVGGCW